MPISMDNETHEYFKSLKKEANKIYKIAQMARSKGLDPRNSVEILFTEDLASRVEGLLELKGVADRIRELSKTMEREAIAYKITDEIVSGFFIPLDDEEAADKALRIALAILTEGITAAPLEGIAEVRIKENFDGSKYLAVYYAGPIRSAGGTETAQTILIADVIRRRLGLAPYKPTEDEISRYVEEIELYERKVTHLQYNASKEEIEFAIRHTPIELTGEPTDPYEVSGHRDLKRVETNRIRGGAVLVINEGLIGRAHKLLKIVKEQQIAGWDWLTQLIELRHKKSTKESKDNQKNPKEDKQPLIAPDFKYLEDVIAGRPVFAYPSRPGGFRLRYGRSRNTGLAGVGINPITMYVLGEFLAVGTHIRTERPGKGAIVAPVTTIEGPTVLLETGEVIQLNNIKDYKKLKAKIKKILYLGDILVAYGEFLENNHNLLPSGYVEEWWVQELKDAIESISSTNVPVEKYSKIITHPFSNISLSDALEISSTFKIPLHPKFNFYWNCLSINEFIELYEYLSSIFNAKKSVRQIPLESKIKQILEKIGFPHKVNEDVIIFSETYEQLLTTILNLKNPKDHSFFEKLLRSSSSLSALEIINQISPIEIKDKGFVFIGARMGRPEKAKERKMNPPVHGLFPIGSGGGKRRDILAALKRKEIQIQAEVRKCMSCGALSPYKKCPFCGGDTVNIYYCESCKLESTINKCPKCGRPLEPYSRYTFGLESYIKKIESKDITLPKLIKGVAGLTNAKKTPELLEKAILRAKYDVYVFKDGTCRFDSTDAPLTHFKPIEIGISLDKLKELGYTKDYLGNPLISEEQIITLKVQDIVLSEKGGEYLLKVAKFVDELLLKVYNLPAYYNAKTKEDLIGHLVIGLAPHTSAGIIGRIIGFTKAYVGYAHPFWHAAKRRNCDGDEDSVILLLDGLLNFSKVYLPVKRGGLMDAPLVLSITLNPNEVDDESWNMDVGDHYPLEFYLKTSKFVNPKNVKKIIDIIEKRLGTPNQYKDFYFTHDTECIDLGPTRTMYKRFKSMVDKVDAQMKLATIIKAVDESDVAQRLINSHFLPDMYGTLRTFSTQTFRCVNCNTIYRRIPLTGKCLKCGGKLLLTVSEGTIKKYLGISKKLASTYSLDKYLLQRIKLLEENIDTVFLTTKQDTDKKQLSLSAFL